MSREDIIREYEVEVLYNVAEDMKACTSKDAVNKIYRQARIWVRLHCYFGRGCTPERARELNNILKHYRWGVLEGLGYNTNGGNYND